MRSPNRKKWLIFAILALLMYAVMSLYLWSRPKDIDFVPPDESNEIEFTDQAYVVDGAELINELGSPERFDFVGKDLYYFATQSYKKYQKEGQVVGFEINSEYEWSDNLLSFTGRFGANNNKISVRIEVLNNDRVYTSITDQNTSSNFDSKLPSNSARNQFIGKMPIETNGYTINYIGDSDSFFVNVFNNSSNYDKAVEKIKSSLGVNDLSDERIIRYGVGVAEFGI